MNIVLPNFYYFNSINENFKILTEEKQKYFYEDLIKIDAEEGNFPFSFWHGDYNINITNDFISY